MIKTMNRNEKYSWFKGIILQKTPLSLCAEFSNPDQGGTELVYKFIFPLLPAPTESITVQTGYTHEKSTEEQSVDWNEIPIQVHKTVLNWIDKQLNTTSSQLTEILSILKEHLEN